MAETIEQRIAAEVAANLGIATALNALALRLEDHANMIHDATSIEMQHVKNSINTNVQQAETALAQKIADLSDGMGVHDATLRDAIEAIRAQVDGIASTQALQAHTLSMVAQIVQAMALKLDAWDGCPVVPEEPEEPEEPVNPDPEEPEEPEEPGPVAGEFVAQVWNSAGDEWQGVGVSKTTNRFLIRKTPEALAAFQVGRTLKLADGVVRNIVAVSDSYGNLIISVDGPRLTPDLGFPKYVTVLAAGVGPTPEEPEEPEQPEEPEEPTDPEEPGPEEPEQPEERVLPMFGANFAGMANNPWFNHATSPSKLGTHYRTSARTNGQPNYFAMYAGHLQPELGDRFINRQPFALERLFDMRGAEPVLMEDYAREMELMMNDAGEYGGLTVLDAHNYCRIYQPTQFNTNGSLRYPNLKRTQTAVNGVSVDAQWFPIEHPGCWIDYTKLAKMYRMIAVRFGSNPNLFAYGLMNEPHTGAGSMDDGIQVERLWIDNCDRLRAAIREVDTHNWVTIAGCGYSTAKNWRSASDRLRHTVDLSDPKIMFEAHQYPDRNGDGGGQWQKGIVHTINPTARVADWNNAKNWCKEVGKPLFAGEFGGPIRFEKRTANSGGALEYEYDVEGAEEYFDALYQYFTNNGILATQWLAGPGDDDNYGNGMDRNNGTLKGNAGALMSVIGLSATYYTEPQA